MSLDQVIKVTISRNTTTVKATGYGTPLIAAYFPTSIFPERVRGYSSVAAMESDGFKSGDPAHAMASAVFAQNPAPTTLKVGRRDGAPQQVQSIAPDAPVVGDEHTVTVRGWDAAATFAARAATTDTYTLPITAAVTDQEDIVDVFVALLPTTGDFAATKVGTGASAKVVITANNTDTGSEGWDGMLFDVSYQVNGDYRPIDDQTPNPATGIETDLAAMNLYDPDWYGFCIDSNGTYGRDASDTAEVQAAAAWAESNEKQFVCQARDADLTANPLSSDTTSIAYFLNSKNYDQTMLFYHRSSNQDYVSAAMLGNALSEDAGTINWAYRELVGVSSQRLNSTEQERLGGTIDAPGGKYCNFVTTLAGVAVTRYGQNAGAEYPDVIRGAFWVSSRIQERIFGLLIQEDKVPYTDAGLQALRSEVLAQLQIGVDRGFIAADPEPVCVVPRAATVSLADKGNRIVSDGFTFRAVLAGAVNYVNLEGELALG